VGREAACVALANALTTNSCCSSRVQQARHTLHRDHNFVHAWRTHTEVYEPFQTRPLHHHHHAPPKPSSPLRRALTSASLPLRVNAVAPSVCLYSRRFRLCCGVMVGGLCETRRDDRRSGASHVRRAP